jgi:teichoic acid transport system permease protein
LAETSRTTNIVNAIHILRQRFSLITYLARMEFRRRYSSTAGGALWMFTGPVLTIFTIWLALEFGLSSSGRFGSDFGVSLAVGLAAWLFFTDAVQSATTSITSNPHLVKKVVFPVWVLPVATTLSAFIVHLAVLTTVIAALWFSGFQLRPHIAFLVLWMAGLVVFAAAVGLFLASLNVRFRDVSVAAPNIVSLLFWLTPIVWPLQQLPNGWGVVARLNPMATIIEGYRAALGVGTMEQTSRLSNVFFGLIVMSVVLLALVTYRRYRPFFADTV